ncbi:MAG TPA: molecular chaperone HtpG [Cytophagales bacterium]|jgi:molecular chaperone HtpG|nr:molecular chaperone HtpG [Cytophagales bacterium]
MQEKGTISIHTENIFPIIKKFLYSDHEIFLRELVSNAVDASQKMQRLASIGEFKGELPEQKVTVKVDKKAKTITVSDNGIGMTADEIKKYINQIAFSGATDFIEKYKEKGDERQIIGMFGLGFYSAFMVAKKVKIVTKSYQEGAEAAQWTCDGSTEFEISPSKRKTVGTDVVLYIDKDNEEFLEDHKVTQILNKYCKFLPVPVVFGTKEETVKEGEKEKKVKKDNVINDTIPLWTKTPTDLKDEDYLNFYRELYPMAEDPLFWIHLNVDYPFNLTGILYFPKIKNEFEANRNKIQLYSKQVFITDDVKDIVPEFLILLHGVIDSPDIPLNVSRSYLQSDSNVKKINNHITKKVADKLGELFKKDREVYEQKWESLSIFVKYGMMTEDKFYEKAEKFLLLESTEGKKYTIEEFKEAVKDNQTDKNGQLVYLYTTELEKQHSYIENAKNKGYVVLKMDGMIDSHFINSVEMKLEKATWKRVDADIADNLVEKDEKKESVLSKDDQDAVKKIFEESISQTPSQITVDALSPDEMPVVITMNEFMRRMKDMQASGGGGMAMFGDMPDNYNVVINGNHALIGKILKAESEDQKKALAKEAFELALLSQGMLSGAALTEFVKRSVQLITEEK